MNLDELARAFVPSVVRNANLSPGTHQAALDELDRQLGPVDASAPGPDEASQKSLDEARGFADAITGADSATPPPIPPQVQVLAGLQSGAIKTNEAPIAEPATPTAPVTPTTGSPPVSEAPSPPLPVGNTTPPNTVTQTSSGPANAPGTSPSQVDPSLGATEELPPRNPLLVPTYARGVNQKTSRSDVDLARRQTDIDVQAAEQRAKVLEDSTAIELTAQKAADARVKSVQDAQDRAREELSRRSDVLAKAAEQRLAERPGSHTRAAGRALLSIAAGMGSKSAENLFNASLAEEERNERNDIARKQADMDALSKSAGVAGDQFSAFGASAINETSLAAAQSMAREKVALKQLEAGVARLAPGSARIAGDALVNKLRRDSSDREISLAQAQVKAAAEWMALHPVAINKSPGNPPTEPKVPTLNESGHEGESDVAYNTRMGDYQRQKAYYDTVALPKWKKQLSIAGTVTGKAGAARDNTQSPMSQWEDTFTSQKNAPGASLPMTSAAKNASASSGRGKPGSSAVPASKIPGTKEERGAAGGLYSTQPALHMDRLDSLSRDLSSANTKGQTAPSAQASEPEKATDASQTPADMEKARLYGINFRDGKILIKPGETPVFSKTEQVGDLRNDVASAQEGLQSIQALAMLELSKDTTVADVAQRNPTIGHFLKSKGINIESTDKTVADTVRHLLIAKIAADVKERSQKSQENFAAALPEEAWLGGNAPEKVKGSLAAVIDFMTGDTTSKLQTHNYDIRPDHSDPWNRTIDDTKASIDGIGKHIETAKERGKRLASSDMNLIDAFKSSIPRLADDLGNDEKRGVRWKPLSQDAITEHTLTTNGQTKWKFRGLSNKDAQENDALLQQMGAAELDMTPGWKKLDAMFNAPGTDGNPSALPDFAEMNRAHKQIAESKASQVEAAKEIITREMSRSPNPKWLKHFELPLEVAQKIAGQTGRDRSVGKSIEDEWKVLRPFITKFLVAEGSLDQKFGDETTENARKD